ncbi:3-phosphoshikimate 1-carboxyvinyltransferase [Buchnera aphidicola (Protaphis terricola)]|uniref:3-phosphoshikimate 1-carboxyvinyltransferase n=1 Tax=Buchnera aphidicola TaxID=9 RepID=UPI00346470C6
MQKILKLNPVSYVNGTIFLPGSKSISNRVLLLASISCGTTYINNLLDSEDTQYMLHALKKIGIYYSLSNNNKVCCIKGNIQSFKVKNPISLFLGNAGTAIRPLLSIFSLYKNEVILTGNNRMNERPIKDLVDALRQGGAIIQYKNNSGYPPICTKGGFKGGVIILNGSISSQFLTSLLIISPLSSKDTTILIKGNLVSKPYIDITLNLMKNFGIEITHDSYSIFYIKSNQKYKTPGKYSIEGDASSASYFLAAPAIKGESVKVIGIDKKSIQGDVKFANILEKMGVIIQWGDDFIISRKGELNAIDLDMNDIPDAAMTIAVLALFAKGTTTIRNIYNWRVKETDRLSAMSNELKKVGANIKTGTDFISITPPKFIKFAQINTYNDHRIAMCFSLLCLSSVGVEISNPNCVVKTYPEYFKDFLHICKF